MKLLRWAVAGAASASVYVVYRYSIGKKAKGESVLETPERTVAKLTQPEPVGKSAEPVDATGD